MQKQIKAICKVCQNEFMKMAGPLKTCNLPKNVRTCQAVCCSTKCSRDWNHIRSRKRCRVKIKVQWDDKTMKALEDYAKRTHQSIQEAGRKIVEMQMKKYIEEKAKGSVLLMANPSKKGMIPISELCNFCDSKKIGITQDGKSRYLAHKPGCRRPSTNTGL